MWCSSPHKRLALTQRQRRATRRAAKRRRRTEVLAATATTTRAHRAGFLTGELPAKLGGLECHWCWLREWPAGRRAVGCTTPALPSGACAEGSRALYSGGARGQLIS